MKKNKFEFIIDSEFQSQIPALTDEEFQQLEENILSEGEVLSPLIVWGNILVDGHNRYKILQQHPEIPYTTRSISCTCETREDVLAWICKHQLGRRNLTPEQKKFLIGKQYHSEKSIRGGNHGNQYTQVANCQIDNLPYQNVFLTAKEYRRLKADFSGLDDLIEQLSAYIQSTGKKYADHAATLRIWAKRQKTERKSTPGIPDYTFKEGESL